MQKQSYDVVALDMDGTLLNSDHATTRYTREVLRRAEQAGKVIALATGRCLSELLDHAEEIGAVHYIICENGACIYDVRAKKCISRVPIAEEKMERLMELSQRFDAVVQFFMEDQAYMRIAKERSLEPYHVEEFRSVFEKGSVFAEDLFERYRATRQQVDKVNFYFRTEEDRLSMQKLLENDGLAMVYSIGLDLEISTQGVNKADGLGRLCDHLKLPLSSVMAVGDGGNDLDIMRAAGLSVAMGNAIPEVIELADAVTDDNDHDGAAKAIERFALAEQNG